MHSASVSEAARGRTGGQASNVVRGTAVLAMSMLVGLVASHAGGAAAAADEARKTRDTAELLVTEARGHLETYFRRQVAEIEQRTRSRLDAVTSEEQWKQERERLRAELKDMLGLVDASLFDRDRPLHAVVTGSVSREGVVVEKLHFQSLPHLYVTANLYRPEKIEGRLPAVLYVCGHGRVKIDGVSYGNKVHYQHHGVWFAQHGYVCLAIDTIQLGEIEGIHHGTYRHGMWWWNARGYTPAGVEAFHAMRAIDYLTRRPEVDPQWIGVTGRSGGGAYSWWVTALDDRVKAAVPVAGITSLRNHVVDDCIEGHCDCMYPVNAYRWDFPLVAALAAPRPLLISNTDKDRIFPLDGVIAVYNQTRQLYQRLGMLKHIGLNIEEGPHRDTQQLRVSAFHWMNRFLQSKEELIRRPAEPLFTPQELKVFETLPDDQINSSIHERFVPAHEVVPPANQATWRERSEKLKQKLLTHVFGGWPAQKPATVIRVRRNAGKPRGLLQKVRPQVLPRLRQNPRPQAQPRLLRRRPAGHAADRLGLVSHERENIPREHVTAIAADQQKPRIEVRRQDGRIEVRVHVAPGARAAAASGRPGAVVVADLGAFETNGLRVELFELKTQPFVSLPLVWLRRATHEDGKKRSEPRQPPNNAREHALRLVVLDRSQWPGARAALRQLLAGKSRGGGDVRLWVRDLIEQGSDRASDQGDGGPAPAANGEAEDERHARGRTDVQQTIAAWKSAVEQFPAGVLLVAPRGVGPTDWAGDDRFRTHIRRRFVLLGQTVDGMQVWDIACAMEAARHLAGQSVAMTVGAEGQMAVNTLYAQWIHPVARRLELDAPTVSHAEGPIYLNVLRYTDVPEVLASVLLDVSVLLRTGDAGLRAYLADAVKRLDLPADQLTFRE